MFYHMQITQGSDYEVSFTTNDPETGLPLNLTTGYTLSGRIAKTTQNGEVPLYTWPVSSLGLVPQNGRLIVRIPGSVSADWNFSKVRYGIKILNNGTGGEVMGIRGPLTVIHTVE